MAAVAGRLEVAVTEGHVLRSALHVVQYDGVPFLDFLPELPGPARGAGEAHLAADDGSSRVVEHVVTNCSWQLLVFVGHDHSIAVQVVLWVML